MIKSPIHKRQKTLKKFQEIMSKCLRPKLSEREFTLLNPIEQFDSTAANSSDKARSLNSAFLIMLAGEAQQAYSQAHKYLHQMWDDPEWQSIADFYLRGLEYIPLLYFSSYAAVLSENMASIKERVDPFTGCFISNLPKRVVYLRFALKAASLVADNNTQIGLDFVDLGSERISEALTFIEGEESPLKQQLQKEQDGWRSEDFTKNSRTVKMGTQLY